eukprot:4970433-Pleurochrysis_carterae.AAC.3
MARASTSSASAPRSSASRGSGSPPRASPPPRQARQREGASWCATQARSAGAVGDSMRKLGAC